MWESERYDWTLLEAVGGALDVPGALQSLAEATTEEEARAAYWRIDNTVVVQGSLRESALPTAACLVNILVSCTAVSRPFILELLQQISDGVPQAGKESIAAAINSEVRRAFGVYAGLLQTGSDFERELCVDLAVSCARFEIELIDRVRFYLERLATDPTTSNRVREYAGGCLQQV